MALAFRPPWWSIPPTVLAGSLFVGLGLWQLDRAWQKEGLQSAFDEATTDARVNLRLDTPTPDVGATVSAQAQGRYAPDRQLLLDNQPRERVPGYRVWTPLQIPGGWLIVDRGWVAADADRRRLPSIDVDDAPRTVRGYWRPLPAPGLRLDSQPCREDSFPRVVSYPTAEQLSCVLGAPVANGVLLLDAAEPEGFVREWTTPNPVPPSRHYAYAAQWFAFAATLLVLFVKFSLKRLP